MFDYHIKERFWETHEPKKIEKGWWEFAGYWIVKMDKKDWVLCVNDDENPRFISRTLRGRLSGKLTSKENAFRIVAKIYVMMRLAVESLEKSKCQQ